MPEVMSAQVLMFVGSQYSVLNMWCDLRHVKKNGHLLSVYSGPIFVNSYIFHLILLLCELVLMSPQILCKGQCVELCEGVGLYFWLCGECTGLDRPKMAVGLLTSRCSVVCSP